jgi:hypothetical protein
MGSKGAVGIPELPNRQGYNSRSRFGGEAACAALHRLHHFPTPKSLPNSQTAPLVATKSLKEMAYLRYR